MGKAFVHMGYEFAGGEDADVVILAVSIDSSVVAKWKKEREEADAWDNSYIDNLYRISESQTISNKIKDYAKRKLALLTARIIECPIE